MMIDLPRDSATLKRGDTCYICRCGQSKKPPFCDGSHHAYNDETANSIYPIKVTVDDN